MKKDKISELEKKVIDNKKKSLLDTMDPLLAGFEEMVNSFLNVFGDDGNGNKITIEMEKFEKNWFNKK